jgi:hypothetical protein
MRPRALLLALAALLVLALSGCGSTKLLHSSTTVTVTVGGRGAATTPQAAARLGFPQVATKNTTRVGGADPVADAVGVALAVYPSQATGTHPRSVVLAPTDDWEASIAASVLMAAPLHAPLLLSGAHSLPVASSDALTALAPTGAGAIDGAQVVRVGDVPTPALHSRAVSGAGGSGPYSLAAAIDRLQTAAAGTPSHDVVVASSTAPAYAMPAAGWAAESGDPVLFVSRDGVPTATAQALRAHRHPRIYVLGPPSVVSSAVVARLRRYGTVKRVGAAGAAANSVAFAVYRDPPCPTGRACAHVAGSFGWAMRSPGHGYTLLNADRPLDAAASAALSGTGDYGPQLLVDNPSTLPKPVLNFFLNYATPGYTAGGGPTAGVYNHGWVIGDTSAVSVPVQSELDDLLQIIPVSTR